MLHLQRICSKTRLLVAMAAASGRSICLKAAVHDRLDNLHYEYGNFWVQLPTAARIDSLTGSGAYSRDPTRSYPRATMTSNIAPAQSSSVSPESVFDWADPLLLDEVLSDEERMVRESAHAYCQEKLFPRVLEANRH